MLGPVQNSLVVLPLGQNDTPITLDMVSKIMTNENDR